MTKNPYYAEIVRAELMAHDIRLCRGCDFYNSHKRGFANRDTRTIHMSAEFATRSTLHGFLHEVGHIVNNTDDMRRYEREKAAEQYARRSLRIYGVRISRKVVQKADAYITRFKEIGDKIIAARQEVL